jgi:hypothetical protein
MRRVVATGLLQASGASAPSAGIWKSSVSRGERANYPELFVAPNDNQRFWGWSRKELELAAPLSESRAFAAPRLLVCLHRRIELLNEA